jgi:hypothetical protein
MLGSMPLPASTFRLRSRPLLRPPWRSRPARPHSCRCTRSSVVGEEVFLYAVPKQLGYFQAEGLDVGIQGAQSGTVSRK